MINSTDITLYRETHMRIKIILYRREIIPFRFRSVTDTDEDFLVLRTIHCKASLAANQSRRISVPIERILIQLNYRMYLSSHLYSRNEESL